MLGENQQLQVIYNVCTVPERRNETLAGNENCWPVTLNSGRYDVFISGKSISTDFWTI